MKNNLPDPYINYPELTFRGIILGALITVIFTASNVYLDLKVGLTFASSIPAAVISMAILKFAKDSNILENNPHHVNLGRCIYLNCPYFTLTTKP